MPDHGADIIRRFGELKTRRSNFEAIWEDVRMLVRPDTKDFMGQTVAGERKGERIYDGTAPWSVNQLASGLHSLMTSAVDRWFNIGLADKTVSLSNAVLTWLEEVSDIIYQTYSKPESKHASSLHEGYLDIASVGTGIIYQDWNSKKRSVQFKSYPLADCFCLENSDGDIDTVFRRTDWTLRNIVQEFGEANIKMNAPKIYREFEDSKRKGNAKVLDKPHVVIHAVFPRQDRNASKLNATNKLFASYWVDETTKEIIRESGYDELPYHVGRWAKIAGEDYGRGPAMVCLPDIKMINQMQRTVLKGAQKVVDPPMMMPNEGVLMPLLTRPGAFNYYDSLEPNSIFPLETRGKIHIGLDMIDRVETNIIRCFFVDWLLQQKNNVEMTATEVIDRRNEKLSQMGPMIGRIQSEWLGPKLRRTANLLFLHGRIPPMPPELRGRDLDIEYVSPAARAQFSNKIISIRQYLEDLAPLVQVSPDVVDRIDPDATAKEIARLRDVSRKVLRDDESVSVVRQERKQQQELLNQAEVGKKAASAVKDLATAQEKGGIGGVIDAF